MNARNLALARNNTARLFRHTSKIHRGCVRLNAGNTYAHELKKFRMCWALLKSGKEFITECETEDRTCRADIVDLDGKIIEIVCTEEEASITSKNKRYPLIVVAVRA